MILIADGGSTKTNWCLINESGRKIYFNTEGYNPYFVTSQYIIDSLNKSLPADLDKGGIHEVNYYGAGCSSEQYVKIVVDAMQVVFQNAKVYVGHDLLAACRALLGNNAGFAAILGTGTNTSLYDGNQVTLNIDSLGYFLGDEGSGCYIGRHLLADYLRGYLPKPLHEQFVDTYNLTPDDIIAQVYGKPLPNRFCASFSKFVYDTKDAFPEYCIPLVTFAFSQFFEKIVSHYPNFKNYELNVIGSVGYSFRDVLSTVADNYEMGIGKVIRSPIDDLVAYHLENY